MVDENLSGSKELPQHLVQPTMEIPSEMVSRSNELVSCGLREENHTLESSDEVSVLGIDLCEASYS